MLKRRMKWVPTVRPPPSGRSTLQCSVAASTAGLKFLHRKSRVRLGISNRQAALEIVDLASALYFPKFVQEGAATDYELRKEGTGPKFGPLQSSSQMALPMRDSHSRNFSMSNEKKRYRIAVIPGDGIGKEVIPEGLRVLEAAAKKHGVAVHFDHFDFASYDYYEKHGEMMPEDWKAQIGKHDAIYFGAVGWPAKIPDHISLWGSLIKFRREFDQYVNLRPVRLMPGVPSPLAGRKPGDIDFWVVRENTEGEYSSVGGRMFPDTSREFVTQQTVMTRIGVDRILKFAFELAQSRPKKHLTSE